VEDQMNGEGYEGLLQLASFHPKYQFGGTPADAAENFTNRSPFPILHLLRENSVSKALDHHSAPDQIPERNIQLMKEKGSAHWKNILKAIKAIH
jgi:hypothetical protein